MSRVLISECVRLAGSQVALAEKMKPFLPKHLQGSFRQGHISNWLCLERQSPVPPGEYVLAMSLAVDGQVATHELRSDLYPKPAKDVA